MPPDKLFNLSGMFTMSFEENATVLDCAYEALYESACNLQEVVHKFAMLANALCMVLCASPRVPLALELVSVSWCWYRAVSSKTRNVYTVHSVVCS